MNKSIFTLLLLLLGIIGGSSVYAQLNFLGKPGVMTTPSAAWEEDRHLSLSFAYLPNDYSIFQSPGELNNTHFYNARVGMISFLEVGLSIAHRPDMAEQVGVGDRQLDFRFRLFRERKYMPAIVLGWTPPGSASPVMSHDYLVATKNINTRLGNLRITGGYGSPYVIVKNPDEDSFLKSLHLEEKSELRHGEYLSGFFGSLAYMPVDFGGVAVEYNTETFNMGAFVRVWDWLHLQAYTFEGKDWAFQFGAQVPLDFLPRTLRRHEKTMD